MSKKDELKKYGWSEEDIQREMKEDDFYREICRKDFKNLTSLNSDEFNDEWN